MYGTTGELFTEVLFVNLYDFHQNKHRFHCHTFPGDVSPSPLPSFGWEDRFMYLEVTARIFKTSYFGPEFWEKAFEKIQGWVSTGKWPRGFGKARRAWFEQVAPHISYAQIEYRDWTALECVYKTRVALIAPQIHAPGLMAVPDNNHWDIIVREVRVDLPAESSILHIRDHCYAISSMLESGKLTPLEMDYLKSWSHKIADRFK